MFFANDLQDYIVTTYIAEFFNTLTNLTYRMFIDALDSPVRADTGL